MVVPFVVPTVFIIHRIGYEFKGAERLMRKHSTAGTWCRQCCQIAVSALRARRHSYRYRAACRRALVAAAFSNVVALAAVGARLVAA